MRWIFEGAGTRSRTRRAWPGLALAALPMAALPAHAAPPGADPQGSPAPLRDDPSPTCVPPRGGVGPEDAPLQVLLYLDPALPRADHTWRRARTLVADAQGLLRIELAVTRGPIPGPTTHDEARALVLAAAAASPRRDPTAALAHVGRRGTTDLARRSAVAEDRRALAEAIGADPGALERWWGHRPCLDRVIAEDTVRANAAARRELGGHVLPPPLAVMRAPGIAARWSQEDPELSGLRARVDALARDWRRQPPARRAGGRPIPGPRDDGPWAAYPELGLTLGPATADHHLAVFAEAEGAAVLMQGVSAGLVARHAHPGRVTLQIVARGDSGPARTLRRRLCAARHAGLGPAYAHLLAGSPGIDPARGRIPLEGPRRPEAQLLHQLDEIAADPAGPCAEEGATPPALPRGVWFDGSSLNATQLAGLTALVAAPRRAGEGAAPWLWPTLTR